MHNQSSKWITIFTISLIASIIGYFIIDLTEDGTTGGKIVAIIELINITICIISVIKYNMCEARTKNMSASEYILDRFENTMPKDNKTNNMTVKCPYCQSTNTKKYQICQKLAL